MATPHIKEEPEEEEEDGRQAVTGSEEGGSGAGGEPPTVRSFIFSAIGVMKNRKARPDTKRICNWIHRRYYGSSPFLDPTPTHFDKCHEMSRIFMRTEQTFASARSFGVIF